VELSLGYWQHLYDQSPDRVHRVPLFRRLVTLIRVLLPAYDGHLWLFTDAEAFECATGIGPLFPPEMRLSMSDAFSQWLDAGRHISAERDSLDLAGQYTAYFPWLVRGAWHGEIAQAKARLYQDKNTGAWLFESTCNVEDAGPLLFAGQLRFTGTNSVILVGFTCYPRPISREAVASVRLSKELLLHPYRLPSSAGGVWHGSTTFIDTNTFDYTGTVPHVMLRSHSRVPRDADWHREIHRSMRLLRVGDREYERIRGELDRCPTRLRRANAIADRRQR
jgi:hypothetical protein